MDKKVKKQKDKMENGSKKKRAERTVHTTFRFIFHPEINYSLF